MFLKEVPLKGIDVLAESVVLRLDRFVRSIEVVVFPDAILKLLNMALFPLAKGSLQSKSVYEIV